MVSTDRGRAGTRSRAGRFSGAGTRGARIGRHDPSGPGTDRRRVRGDRADPRSRAEPPRAGDVRRDVVRALLLQVVPDPPQAAADRGASACSSGRARTPAWSTSATASPPPSASRATTTRRPSSPTRARPPGVGGILRDIFTMGARPDRPHGPAALRSARRRPQPLDRRGRRQRHLGLRQLGRRARPSAARPSSTRPTPSNPLVNVLCLGVLPDRPAGARPGHRRRQPGRAARLDAPGATASAGSACWPRPASPTTRPTPTSGRASRSATRSRRSG